MSMAWPYIVFALALGWIWAARRGTPAWLNGVAWVVLAAGFAFLLWGDSALIGAVGVAAVAGFAAVLPMSKDVARRLRIAAFSCVVPVCVAGAAIACVPDATPIWGSKLVLFAAAWAAMVAALTSFVAAMGVGRRPLSTSVGLAISGAAGAALVAGSGRSSLPDSFYGLSLRTGEELVRWVIGPVPGFDSGITLSVAAAAPQIEWTLVGLIALGFVAIVSAHLDRAKVAGIVLGIAGGVAVVLLSALPVVVGGLSMPDGDPYASEVKRRLLARGGERVVESGAFNSTADISVAMADMGPEVAALLFIALLGLVAFIAVRRDPASEPEIDRAFARDLLVRGVAFLWGAWFVLLIIHNGFLGSPGMGSPGEWVFTGVCVTASGLVFAAWETPSTRLGKALVDFVPGLIVTALLIAAGLAWRFGALPGLSLGILG